MTPVAGIELHFIHFMQVVKKEFSTGQIIDCINCTKDKKLYNGKMNTKDQFIFLLLLLKNFTMVKATHLILLNIFATVPV